jgi:hypothetical protein
MRMRGFVAGAWVRVLLVLLALSLVPFAARADGNSTSTVGVPAKLTDVVLPGSELEVIALDPKAPVLVRIAATYPHGSEFRYDLEYQGLDPGEYDLTQFLKRKDGTSTADLPHVPVTVRSLLPPGVAKPHAPEPVKAPALGGYALVLIAIGIAWVAGLFAILFVGRKRRLAQDAAGHARPKTLAERLRPLVERARAGTLTPRERAQLELGLVAHWRRRLALDDRRPEEVLVILRAHGEAGPLLTSLEDWLHRPDPPEVDIAALLEPYRNLPPDDFDSGDFDSAPRADRAEAWSS